MAGNNRYGVTELHDLNVAKDIARFIMHTEHKKKMAALSAGDERKRATALEAELTVVNERLVVLERIVTDRRYDLDDEIRQLDTA